MMLLGRRRFWTALVNPGAAGNSVCFSTQFITPVAQMVNEQWSRDQKQEERSSNEFIIERLIDFSHICTDTRRRSQNFSS